MPIAIIRWSVLKWRFGRSIFVVGFDRFALNAGPPSSSARFRPSSSCGVLGGFGFDDQGRGLDDRTSDRHHDRTREEKGDKVFGVFPMGYHEPPLIGRAKPEEQQP